MSENEKKLKPSKNLTEIQGEITLIFLNDRKITIIDTRDFDKVKNYSWRAVKASRLWYVKTTVGSPSHRTDLSLHRMIAKTPCHQICHHKNRNSLDNRKSNLQNMDSQEHTAFHQMNNLIIQYE